METMLRQIAGAVETLFGDSIDDETFAAIVDLAVHEEGRRTLERAEVAPSYVVVDGVRLYSNGERCTDW